VWLADPGFGSSPPAPLSLRRYHSGAPLAVGGWVYEVAPDEDEEAGLNPGAGAGGDRGRPDFLAAERQVWKLRSYFGGEWVTLHRWDEAAVHPVDVMLSNYYTSTHPDSWFTWQPVIVRRDPEAIRSIVGRSYTVAAASGEKVRRELTDGEFAAALTGEFGLTLSADEVAAAVAAPAGRERQAPPGVAPGR
jgi:arylamine N-acetyltransferase